MIEMIARLALVTALVGTTPVNGDPTIWAQWGLAGLVVGFTLWRDYHRERRMSEALERHQTWVQITMLRALERNTQALERLMVATNGKGAA